jgi:7-cyano-7-deazaguanine synthase
MMGVAESIGASYVALGVHSGDHFIYPDCRPNYLKALSRTMIEATEGKVRLMCPFEEDTKESILRIGYNLSIVPPYHLTRTCYKNQPNSCGKCGSCVERLEAFAAIGKVDPIKYD